MTAEMKYEEGWLQRQHWILGMKMKLYGVDCSIEDDWQSFYAIISRDMRCVLCLIEWCKVKGTNQNQQSNLVEDMMFLK
jgi:hypothetical protein